MAGTSIKLLTELPGPRSLSLMKERNLHVARGPFHVTPIFIEKAQGALVTDVDGNTLLDFSSGIGVTNLGHSPKEVVSHITEQASHFLHSSFNVLPYERYVRVCEELNRRVPGSFQKKSFLVNSGAEAVENAIKIARAYTKKTSIIAFDHAFHGRTYMAMSATYKGKPYKENFGPFPPEVYHAPFPYFYRWTGPGNDEDEIVAHCFHAFETLCADVGRDKIACILIEPVLGEGGFLPTPPRFLSLLSEYCRQYGIVVIADEVQSGFGRTGTFFASESLGFVPDLLVSGKAIASGLPLSAVTGRAEIMDAPQVGGIGGTFGGNPIACAAALAVFKCLDNSVLSKTQENANILRQRLNRWSETFQEVGNVRGLGFMQAMELVKDRESKEPDPARTKKLVCKSYQNGVILMSAGSYGNVIRFLPPIQIEPLILNEGLDVVEDCIKRG